MISTVKLISRCGRAYFAGDMAFLIVLTQMRTMRIRVSGRNGCQAINISPIRALPFLPEARFARTILGRVVSDEEPDLVTASESCAVLRMPGAGVDLGLRHSNSDHSLVAICGSAATLCTRYRKETHGNNNTG